MTQLQGVHVRVPMCWPVAGLMHEEHNQALPGAAKCTCLKLRCLFNVAQHVFPRNGGDSEFNLESRPQACS
eukprot:158751-Chlamydomonas_euryale.AAC.4